MPKKKRRFTQSEAELHGLFPARPIARVIQKWCDDHWWLDEGITGSQKHGSLRELGELCAISHSVLVKVMYTDKEWLEFDKADRLVQFIDHGLWHSDAELSALYQSYRFNNLDLARPTSPAADPLNTVKGMTIAKAAEVLGVPMSTMGQARYGRSRYGPRHNPNTRVAVAA